MNRVDILDLEYASKGRDVDISEPILSFLELNYNLKIVRKCCFQDWQYYLLKYRPKIVFIANGIGSKEQFHIVKTACFLGIKVVTHFSEGDFTETPEGVVEFFWGWNKDRILYEDLHLEWSQRNIILTQKHIGNFSNIKLSGAVGFDKYKLLKSSFMKKSDFLAKYNKSSFNKIVGIAGWGFNLFLDPKIDFNSNSSYRLFSNEQLDNIKKSKDLVQNIIKSTIKENPDVLFVLKYHPLIPKNSFSELYDLPYLDNMIYLQTEETIFDLINVCDVWGAYESTTAMETWLIGDKPTFLIQPIENDFVRSKISEGSPKIRTAEDLQFFLDEFFSEGRSKPFDQLASKRQEIIERVIQWADGKNHQRAAEYIYDLYKNGKNKPIRINRFVLYIYLRFIYKKITRQIRKILRLPLYIDKRFTDKEREEWHQIYYDAIKKNHK